MSLLTQELLKKKLSNWTLSSKVAQVLGFSDSQANEIKQELATLVEMGLVERDGDRRGLKFRVVNPDNVNEDEQDSSDDSETEQDSIEALPGKQNEAVSLRAFAAQLEAVKHETDGKSPLQLMSVITDLPIKDPSILSHTLAYKRMADGSIVVSFWSGCIKTYEKSYSAAAFAKSITNDLKAITNPKSVKQATV